MNRRPPNTLSNLKVWMILLGLSILACCIVLIVVKSSAFGSSSGASETPKNDWLLLTLPRDVKDGELFFGGDKDDTVLCSLSVQNITYIIGTTLSHTGDMTSGLSGSNLYAAAIHHNVTLTHVVVFGTNGNDVAVAAHATADGIAVFVNTETGAKTFLVRYHTLLTEQIPLSFESKARAVDCYPSKGNVYYLCETDGRLSVSVDGHTPLLLDARRASYVAMYPFADGIHIFANIEEYGVVLSVSSDGVECRSVPKINAVAPTNDGFCLVSGNSVLKLNSDWSVQTVAALPPVKSNIRLIPVRYSHMFALADADSLLFTLIGSLAIPTVYGQGNLLDVNMAGHFLTVENEKLYHNGNFIAQKNGIVAARYSALGILCTALGRIGGTDITYFPLTA